MFNIKQIATVHTLSGALILFAVVYSDASLSAGFQLIPTTSGIVRSGGGNGIIGDDPGDMFYNPAGLSLQPESAVQGDVYFLEVENKFIDNGSTQSVLSPVGPLTFPLAGSADSSSSDTGIAPILFFVNKLSDDLTFGLGITTPFGLSTTYEEDWIGRYHTTKAELVVVDVNPAISKRVNDKLIVAGGLSVQYASSELSQALPTPTPGVDAKIKVEGDDTNLGFNAGIILTPTNETRVGLAYRSKVSHDLSGNSTQSVMGAPLGRMDATAPLTLPESVYLTFYHSLKGTMDRWSVAGGLRWTKWSRFEQIRTNFADGTSDVSIQNWDNTVAYGVSTDYQVNDRTKLIFGLASEQSPVPDPVFRTAQVPDTDRTLISIGVDRDFSWRSADYTFGFGWQRVLLDSGRINRTRPLSASFSSTLAGEFDDHEIDVFSIKLIKKLGNNG